MVKTVLAQQEADSLNLMAITYRETLWEDTASAGCSCTCRSLCHLGAVMSVVRYTASRDFGPSAACPVGQRLGSGRVAGDLVCRAGHAS